MRMRIKLLVRRKKVRREEEDKLDLLKNFALFILCSKDKEGVFFILMAEKASCFQHDLKLYPFLI